MNYFRRALSMGYKKFYGPQHRQIATNHSKTVTEYGNAWTDPQIPKKQWEIVQAQLLNLTENKLTPEFAVFLESVEFGLKMRSTSTRTLLEIGCSSGYYGQVLHSRYSDIEYTGVDFSEEFIKFGKAKFPTLKLQIGDTTNLQFENRAFGIVVSASVLLHVFEWKQGVVESARVANDLLILHRMPVSKDKTALFTKNAYGVKMIEWTFNDDELISEVKSHGFRLINSTPVYPGHEITNDSNLPVQFTYLFERV
jgi:2-polyprenyl-3-methyl-5-hydroxy-6-metoxy-1,4-benzoquinol methylase